MPEEKSRLKIGQELYKYAKNHPNEEKWRKSNEDNLKYFTGTDQGWTEHGDKANLEAEGRPALTLNRIHPLIRLICGARPKTESKYLPTESGTPEAAQIMNTCKDHVEDINKWDFLEDDWFKYFCVVNRAIISIMPDYRRDIRGDVSLKLLDGYQSYLDWDAVEKDRSDAQYYFYVRSLSKDEAERLWPDKKEEIKSLIGQAEVARPQEARDVNRVDKYRDPQAEYYDIETKQLQVPYYWYKTHEKAVKVIDKATNQVHDSKLSKKKTEKELKDLGAEDRYSVLERDYIRVHYMVFSDDIVFEEGITPWERADGQRTWLSENFPDIVAEPDRIIFGTRQELIELIEAYKDPQKFHNKLSSAILHIINTQAKSGYDYETGAITEANLKKLNESGSKPGTNIEWTHMDKMKPRSSTAMPQAEMAMADRMARSLLDVSGIEGMVSADSLGKNAPAKSREFHYAQGANAISWIYKSFMFFKQQLADYIRDAVQTQYDYEKVVRMRGKRNKTIKINEKIYDNRGGVEKILNDVTIGQFDTQIREDAVSPTIRTERFKHFSEMVKSGELQLPPPVLMEVVLDLMDDLDLKELVEESFGKFIEEQKAAAQQGGNKPQLKESLSLDKIFPLVSRQEQIQILQQVGIQPDQTAKSAGLPDSNSLIELQKDREDRTHKEKMAHVKATTDIMKEVAQGTGAAA